MSLDLNQFCEISVLLEKSELEKAKLFAYFLYKTTGKNEFTVTQIVQCFESQHLGTPNISRLKRNLTVFAGFVAANSSKGTFKLHAKALAPLDESYAKYFAKKGRLVKTGKPDYIDATRIAELQALTTANFDLRKLLKMCEELNTSHDTGALLAIAMLVRALIDHVPPIFGYRTFSEVSNNYSGGGRSFRESMQRLDEASRKIADQYLHMPIRKSESLPNLTQVDFSPDVDVLLGEIVRVLRVP